MYVETTHDIEIRVEPKFVPEQSDPTANYYFFAYRVRISNHSPTSAKLISRHWIITDGHGHTEEVRGEGVVGEQPLLEPGASYEYTSACPLPTPTGNMRGSYQMQDSAGRRLNVRIPLFFLRHPDTFH